MYIADLHIHSRYSRATSKDGTPEYLDYWARKKGIQIVGTGDFTHPAWREELEEKLEPAEEGLYILKKEYRLPEASRFGGFDPRFVVTGEISSIYKKNEKVRKVHSLILLPGLEDAKKVSFKLETIGNIHSDGRPILGMDCHDLLEVLLELSPKSIYVPAHIWTPHFSLFGAFSGFDSVEECFEDLSGEIHAMETGLSSDPPMNWRISALDTYHLISNSDAHSPAKLGREANLMDIPLSYEGIFGAIQRGEGLAGTLEFFPEEGKYHYDGHRKCNLCLAPREADQYGGKCPVCGKKLTIGVSHRVEQLADRPEGFVPDQARPFESLVPLEQVIGASLGHAPTSSKVQRLYENMLKDLGPEFEILRSIPVEDVKKAAGNLIGEGIKRLREGEVERRPGFDGEYGTIRIFSPEEMDRLEGQMSLFDSGMLPIQDEKQKDPWPNEDAGKLIAATQEPEEVNSGEYPVSREALLNDCQQEAVQAVNRAIAVVAGPGTGKTKTLVSRILYLLETRKVRPSQITAVTFTNQAAGELRERIVNGLGKGKSVRQMQIGTFHAICLELLKRAGMEPALADETQMVEAAQKVTEDCNLKMSPGEFLRRVSNRKAGLHQEDSEDFLQAYEAYQALLDSMQLLDFDDLLLRALAYMESEQGQKKEGARFSYLLVDEFQDSSPLQYQLMKTWNQGGREVFVIGDPDQSIYGFRGSDAACFERLGQDFEELQTIRLIQNYRSVPAVTESAVSLINKNPGPERILVANRPARSKVRLVHAKSAMGEAIFIAKEINRMVGGLDMLEAQEGNLIREDKTPRSFDQIAVLYRTHRQGELLEKCLRREGIPYVVAGREEFLAGEKVKGCMAFLRYLANPADAVSQRQSLKLVWGLDDNEISRAILEAKAQEYRSFLPKGKPEKLIRQWIEEWQLTQEEDMQKLLSMAMFYKTVPELLEMVSLGVESDLKRCGTKRYQADCVTLMTLHGSKGLEFPVTMIYGVNQGSIPYENQIRPAQEEEERRLFYVGMTRARDELLLTTSGEPSCFLKDLSGQWLCRQEAEEGRGQKPRQMSLFDFL